MARSQQLDGAEDRLASYRRWRYGLGDGCYVQDIDQIEWRIDKDGTPFAVAILELTRVDELPANGAAYRAAILKRYESGGQGKTARHVARCLGCHAYIVAYPPALDWFWLYNLGIGGEWWPQSRKQYEAWIRGLG